MMKRLLLIILLALLLPVKAWGVVALDAVSTDGGEFTDDTSWSHGGAAGGIAGAGCWVTGRDDANPITTDVTYGGVSLDEWASSPVTLNSAEDQQTQFWFKGDSLPAGSQTVAVTVGAGTHPRRAFCFTVTAGANTEIVDIDSVTNASLTNPAVTLSLGGRTSFAAIGFTTGATPPAGITPLTNWTSRLEYEWSLSNNGTGFYTYDIVSTTDVTAGFDQTANEDVTMIAVAVSEVQVAGGTKATLTGVGK